MQSLKFSFEEALVSEDALSKESEKLLPYLGQLKKIVQLGGYSESECSINLSNDASILNEVSLLAANIDSSLLKYIFVIGIGGSNLGAQAVYEALKNKIPLKEIIFLDTNDAGKIKQAMQLIERVKKPEEILVNLISKSGSTVESAGNFEIIYHTLVEKFGDVSGRVVVTTDQDSGLAKISEKNSFKTLFIPKIVGGRFSVFSSVGLFPLKLAGIPVEEFIRGGREAITLDEKNPAFISAILMHLNFLQGRKIINTFLFNSELEYLGKWYRQLLAESTGKEIAESKTGLTPITSIGSTDLHSMLQLYLAGEDDKFTFFVSSLKEQGIKIPKLLILKDIVPFIGGKDSNEIMRAILDGVKNSYKNTKLPFCSIEFEEISAYSLGAFMQFKMIETMLLARLIGVNAFDQPNVENYKIVTKRILNAS